MVLFEFLFYLIALKKKRYWSFLQNISKYLSSFIVLCVTTSVLIFDRILICFCIVLYSLMDRDNFTSIWNSNDMFPISENIFQIINKQL